MARYTGPSCKLCRREGIKLFLKGSRCFTEKCAVEKRAYPAGQHGQQRKKLSEFASQLREKQKMKRYYGLMEKQFKNTYTKAAKKPGITGNQLVLSLETRLDTILYRLGFSSSRKQGRQMIMHGHFLVNGVSVDIPSYQLKENDVVKPKTSSEELVKSMLEITQYREFPAWLSLNRETLEGTLQTKPQRDEIDIPVSEHMVVELYSK